MGFAASFPGFRLRLTRWGIAYLAGSVILGLAAVNTGNNSLMALLGLALGSYVVSGTWSRQVLGSVEAKVTLPPEVFADRSSVVDVELANTSGIFPAYGLVVRDGDGRVVICDEYLPTNSRRKHSVEVVFPDRGWHALGPWRLEVVLPLGFFLKSKRLMWEQRVLVYPRLLSNAAQSTRRGGGRRSPDALDSRGREGEVTQLRDYREGDELRAMHWKQTARQRRLVVVERQRAADTPVFFVLDPRLEDPSDPQQIERFERLVSEVATGVVQRLRQGIPVGIVVGSVVVQPVRTIRRAPVLLRPLAEVNPQSLNEVQPPTIDVARKIHFSLIGVTAR
jgi:uncharacterized protein (DUF58 family)